MYIFINKYVNYLNKQILSKQFIIFIFKNFKYDKYIKIMNISNTIPNNNMYRMFISYFRENLIANLLQMKYVGDIKKWETDCIYPNNIININQFHLKYEIKIQKNMFLKNGNSNTIILKNGRSEGSKIKDLLTTIIKNNFILINSSPPYNIAYIEPTKFLYFINSKKNNKTFNQIINDEQFLNTKCAELCAYVEKKDLIYLYKSDKINYKNNFIDQTYDPFKNIINDYIKYNL